MAKRHGLLLINCSYGSYYWALSPTPSFLSHYVYVIMGLAHLGDPIQHDNIKLNFWQKALQQESC